jgi:hypothetical protein
MRQHVLGHAQLGFGEIVQRTADLVENGRPRRILELPQLSVEDRGRAQERRLFGRDDVRRDGLQVTTEAALVLKARAEGRLVEVRAQTGDDAAADVDTAERAQRHCEVRSRGS